MEKVKLVNVRIQYPVLDHPRDYRDNKRFAYSATLWMEDGSPAHKAMEAAIAEEVKEKWGAKATANLKNAKSNNKVCLRKGEDDMEGWWFLRVSTSKETPPKMPKRPKVVNRNPNDVLEVGQAEAIIYGGCYVTAIVRPWAHEYAGAFQVNCDFLAVQFMREGEAFAGGAPKVEVSDFEPAEGADAEDFL